MLSELCLSRDAALLVAPADDGRAVEPAREVKTTAIYTNSDSHGSLASANPPWESEFLDKQWLWHSRAPLPIDPLEATEAAPGVAGIDGTTEPLSVDSSASAPKAAPTTRPTALASAIRSADKHLPAIADGSPEAASAPCIALYNSDHSRA